MGSAGESGPAGAIAGVALVVGLAVGDPPPRRAGIDGVATVRG